MITFSLGAIFKILRKLFEPFFTIWMKCDSPCNGNTSTGKQMRNITTDTALIITINKIHHSNEFFSRNPNFMSSKQRRSFFIPFRRSNARCFLKNDFSCASFIRTFLESIIFLFVPFRSFLNGLFTFWKKIWSQFLSFFLFIYFFSFFVSYRRMSFWE